MGGPSAIAVMDDGEVVGHERGSERAKEARAVEGGVPRRRGEGGEAALEDERNRCIRNGKVGDSRHWVKHNQVIEQFRAGAWSS